MRAVMALVMLMCSTVALNSFSADKLLSFDTPEQEAFYEHLLVEYRCLKCQNQNLAGSNAALAEDLRREIYEQVLSGKSKPDIDDYLVARYGEFVLYRPRFNAVTAFLWIGPFVMLAGGIVGIVVMARRNARRRRLMQESGAREPDEAGSADSISSAELERARGLLK